MISLRIRASSVDLLTISAGQILDYDIQDSATLIAEELPIGTFEAEILANSDTQAQTLLSLQRGYGVWVDVGDNVFAYYFRSIEAIGRRRFRLTAESVIGNLDIVYHKGGLYNGTPALDIIEDIFDLAYSQHYIDAEVIIDPALADIGVYGHLPFDTGRSNLQRLALAIGFSVTTTGLRHVIGFPEVSASPESPADSQVYADPTAEYPDGISTVDVTEHTFRKTELDQPTVLFDNTQGSQTAQHDLVIFDDPAYDLDTEGPLTINESGVNYAIVSGTGQLIGKPYTHSRRILSVNLTGKADRSSVVTVDTVGVISGVNSWNVAQRILGYYNSARILKGSYCSNFLTNPLASVSLPDPTTGSNSVGIVTDTDISPGSVGKNSVKAVAGYTPGPFGNNFTQAQRQSTSGTWTVPEGVTRIRIVAVGGGQGGQGGFNGENGYGGTDLKKATVYEGNLVDMKAALYYGAQQPVAKGGHGGEPGLPGKVFVTDVTVTPGETLTITPGAAGTGGAANGGIGGFGGDTTVTGSFGSVSSASGERLDAGYTDLLNDYVYGLPGSAGIAGGDGGRSCIGSGWGAYGASSSDNGVRVSDLRTENGDRGLPAGNFPAPTVLPANTFSDLTNVVLVILPEGMVSVEDSAFAVTAAAGQITLPESVADLGAGLASNGASIYFEGTKEAWTLVTYGDNTATVYTNACGTNIPAYVGPDVATGPIGDHLTWTLDSGGTLWISGTGELWDETTRLAWYLDHPGADNYTDYNSSITAIAFGPIAAYHGGAGGTGAYYEALVRSDRRDTWMCRAAGGGGGGGAAARGDSGESNAYHGSAGGNASIIEYSSGDPAVTPSSQSAPYNPPDAVSTGGNGGNGGNAGRPSNAQRGAGGTGGNGGGAGGNGGGAEMYFAVYNEYAPGSHEDVVAGTGGTGGNGSVGANGGPGCVAIYY